MLNSKTILLTLLVAASLIASVLIHHGGNAALLDRAALLRRQSQQLADLQTEQQRLSDLVARATNVLAANHSAELAKLRAQAEALRKQTNQLSREIKPRHASPPPLTAAKSRTYSHEYYEQMNQLQGTKGWEARDIGYAMFEYAGDHHNQYPSSLDQITPYLAKENRTLSGTNQFEIVFQGSSDQVDGIPIGSIAVIRDTQTWLDPDGRPTRVYGMMDGSGQTVSSDDNFQSWEAEHIIPAPKAP